MSSKSGLSIHEKSMHRFSCLICNMEEVIFVSKGCCDAQMEQLFPSLSVLIQLKFSGLYLRMIPEMLEGDEGI